MDGFKNPAHRPFFFLFEFIRIICLFLIVFAFIRFVFYLVIIHLICPFVGSLTLLPASSCAGIKGGTTREGGKSKSYKKSGFPPSLKVAPL